jgi:hypothetical protein
MVGNVNSFYWTDDGTTQGTPLSSTYCANCVPASADPSRLYAATAGVGPNIWYAQFSVTPLPGICEIYGKYCFVSHTL